VHVAERHATFDEDAALAAVLRRHPRLSSTPGTRYAYSNIGYWLLGEIVKRASGQPFPSYVVTHVLQPLGVPSQALGYVVPDPFHHAVGYLEKYSLTNLAKGLLIDGDLIGQYHGRWLSIRSHYVNGAAFGGLVGTARGFGRFLQDQLSSRSRLFGDATRALFYAPQHTAGGTPIAMTLGWHIGDLDGTRFFYKEGGGGGFHCMMRLYADRALATVLMSNATGFDVRKYMNARDAEFVR
jgi:CubicO group peptidase (beta-lactamase class C family)